MVTKLDDEVKYESAEDLMNNNAEDGAWKGKFREKFTERSEQIDKMKTAINDEIAQKNIAAAQQAQTSQYIIDPITGEVIEVEGGFEDELSVATVISLIEKGASDDEIEAALDAALTSIAGKIAKDKKNAKKHLAHLLELLHVLETTLKQAGKNVELQNTLRNMQERVSKLMKDGTVPQIQEFLKSSQLREALANAVSQTRNQVDIMRLVRDMNRDLARQAKDMNIPREIALLGLREQSHMLLQSKLNESLVNLKEAYQGLVSEMQREIDPVRRDVLREAVTQIADQGQQIKQLTQRVASSEQTTAQFTKSLDALVKQQDRLPETIKTLEQNQVAQQIVNRLADTQRDITKALEVRLNAQVTTETTIASTTQRGNLENLRAQETVISRNVDAVIKKGLERTANDSTSINMVDLEKMVEARIKPTTDLAPEAEHSKPIVNESVKPVSPVSPESSTPPVAPTPVNPEPGIPPIAPTPINLDPGGAPPTPRPEVQPPKPEHDVKPPRPEPDAKPPKPEPDAKPPKPEPKPKPKEIDDKAKKDLEKPIDKEKAEKTLKLKELFGKQMKEEAKQEGNTSQMDAFRAAALKAKEKLDAKDGKCPGCGGGSCSTCGSTAKPDKAMEVRQASPVERGAVQAVG